MKTSVWEIQKIMINETYFIIVILLFICCYFYLAEQINENFYDDIQNLDGGRVSIFQM